MGKSKDIAKTSALALLASNEMRFSTAVMMMI